MNTPNESPIDASKKLLAATRADKTAKMSASHEARIIHEHALTAVKAEGTPAARKALLAAEDVLRMVELELAGSSERHTAATAELARLERESRLAAHSARAKEITFGAYEKATSKAVQKIVEARARAAEAEEQGRALCRGFSEEAASVASEAAQIGAPPVAVLPYAQILSALVAKAENKPAAAIISEVFQTTAPAGVSPEIALAAVNAGTDMRRVASLVSKLRDSTARACSSAKLVMLGGFESVRGDKTLTSYGRFNAALAEAHAARRELAELMPGADASVQPDALSEKLSAVGAERAHAACLNLRMCAGLTMPGYPTAQELEGHRSAAAAKILSEIEKMGLGEYVERQSAPAQGPAPVSAPAGFVSVGAQAL